MLINAPIVGNSGLDAIQPCAAGLSGSSPPVHRNTTGPGSGRAPGDRRARATSSITPTCARMQHEFACARMLGSYGVVHAGLGAGVLALNDWDEAIW